MKPTLSSRSLPLLLILFATAARAQDSDLLLSSPRPTLNVGDALQVRASLEASILVTPTIEFSSSNNSIATIDGDGVVRGRFPGLVTISAHERTTGAQTRIDLKIIPARIEISPGAADLHIGDSLKFSAVAYDAADNPLPGVSFRFASSEPAVTGIGSDGSIRPVAEGYATIIAQIDSTPSTFGFYATLQVRIGPKRQYSLRRLLVTDPGTSVSTISAFTNLSGSGEVLGGLATLSNGGQAAVVRESNGQLRLVAYAGQLLPNIGKLVVRIPNVSVNARGDVLADIQYPDPWCTHGLVLFPRNGPEIEVQPNVCNPYISRHSMADDGSLFYFLDDARGRHLMKRLPDGTLLTLFEIAGQDPGPKGLRSLNDFFPLRNGSAALLRGTANNSSAVSIWVTEKSAKTIFTAGDSFDGRSYFGHDEMHGGSDGVFYGRCNGTNFVTICRATANGFQAMITNNTPGVNLGWIHTVFDADKGKVVFAGDWNIGDKYVSNYGLLNGTNVTLLRTIPAWNGVTAAQMTASGVILTKLTESDDLLSNVRDGSDPVAVLAKQAPLSTPVPGLPDVANQMRVGGSSSLVAIGAGEQVVSLDSGGLHELLSPLTPLPDGGRILNFGVLAANRNGQAALSVNATGSSRIYKLAGGKLTPLLTPNGPVASSDANKFNYTNYWNRGQYLAINAGGDVAAYADFGPYERLVFIPNGATQVKTIFTYRAPLDLGYDLANFDSVALDDLGRVMFTGNILNGPRALFFWNGQTLKEVARIGTVVDGQTINGLNSIAGGPKGFAILATTPTAWRLHSFDGQSLTTLARGDQPVAGFSRTWSSLSGALTYAGNGDIHVFGSSSDGPGIFVVRPDGSSASVLRAGDVLPEGGNVVQPIGMFAGPAGEVFIAAHIVESGREKIATYLATPLK